MENTQNTLSQKMYPEFIAPIKEKILGVFSKKSQKPKFQCLLMDDGQKAEWLNYQTVQSLGELLTANIGASPNVAVGCTLSQILEVNAPQKYYLSPKACRGILRRAEKRGKELPPLLKAALEAQADGRFLVTSYSSKIEKIVLNDEGGSNISVSEGVIPTLRAETHGNLPCVIEQTQILDMTHANDVIRECGEVSPTLQARMGTGGNQISLVFEPTFCIQGNTIDRSDTAGANGKGVIEGKSYTLNTVDRPAVAYAVGIQPNNSTSAGGLSDIEEKSPTLSCKKRTGAVACYPINTQIVTRSNKLGEGTGMGIGEDGDPAYTLQEAHSHGVIYAEPVSFENSSFGGYKQGVGTLKASGGDYGGGSENLICQPCSYNSSDVEREIVSTPIDIKNKFYVWIVRRLTPLECERLQGFPDGWTKYDTKGNEIKDTPRYKACGNSIAIPCAARVFQGIVEAERGA